MYLSDQYRDLIQKHHRDTSWGGDGAKWVQRVLQRIAHHNLKEPSVLDYGCGQGKFGKELKAIRPDVEVWNYDPGRPEFKRLPPSPVDIVLCSDVLEHVEPEYIDEVIRHIRDLTKVEAVLNISTRLARHILPDGRNAHLIVQPAQWWAECIERNWPQHGVILEEIGSKQYTVTIKK